MSIKIDVASGEFPATPDEFNSVLNSNYTQAGLRTPESMLKSLVAAASRINESAPGSRYSSSMNTQAWQKDAWELYDLVGEFGTAVEQVAKRVSQGRLYVGRLDPAGGDPVELRLGTSVNDAETQGAAIHAESGLSADDYLYDPVPLDSEGVEDPNAAVVLDTLRGLGRGAQGLTQMLLRMALNLEAVSEAWVIGIPRHLAPESVFPEYTEVDDYDEDPYNYDWHVRSINEVDFRRSEDLVTISELPDEYEGNSLTANPEDLYLIRIWNPHPAKYLAAGGPSQRALPVMREILGLSMSIGSQIDSRLAGAGLFLVPQSASQAVRAQRNVDPTRNPLMEDLMEAMLTPIQDRSHPSALVPLMLEVPDESINSFKHMSFSNDLDDTPDKMRTSAIGRLATMLDIPPELLLGTGGMNHWGGWLVKEETVKSHVAPILAMICHALTTQFLWPMLSERTDIDDPTRYAIWFDVSHLVVRPNHSADALALHERGVIRDATLRSVNGFDDSDAPTEVKSMDLALSTALDMVRQAPMLAREPGLATLVTDLRAMLSDPDAAEKRAAEQEGEAEDASTRVEKGAGGLAGGDARGARVDENPGGRE